MHTILQGSGGYLDPGIGEWLDHKALIFPHAHDISVQFSKFQVYFKKDGENTLFVDTPLA